MGRTIVSSRRHSHVLPALIRRALAKETPFRVWGSPDVVRDFVFVDDVVQAALDVLQRHVVCNPVNVGLGRGITIGATVRLILELCDHPETLAVEYGSEPADGDSVSRSGHVPMGVAGGRGEQNFAA